MSTPQAVLFDCDGVLVDSEPLTMRVLRDLLSARGWDMPLTECMRRFVGKATRDEATLIEARTGQPLTQAWLDYFWAERDKVLRNCLQSVPGAAAVVAHVAVAGHRRGNVDGGGDDLVRQRRGLAGVDASSEIILGFPLGVPAAFDIGGLKGFGEFHGLLGKGETRNYTGALLRLSRQLSRATWMRKSFPARPESRAGLSR